MGHLIDALGRISIQPEMEIRQFSGGNNYANGEKH